MGEKLLLFLVISTLISQSSCVSVQDGAQPASVEAQTLHDDDLFAANTLYDQNRVTPHANGSAMYDAESGVVRVSLPPVSWTALHIK